jgi:hypothetical protein
MSPATTTDLPVGRPFDCVFGPFVPRLTFEDGRMLRLDIPVGGTTITQTVAFEATRIAPGIVMLSWAEQDGTFVVHVQDYEARTVASHARLADGTQARSVGTIAWVT